MLSMLFLLNISYTLTAQTNSSKKVTHQLVMQLNTADTVVHKSILKQLHHLKAGWGDSVQIDVVCHGQGIEFIKQQSPFSLHIKQLAKLGITFVACENTMLEKNITKEQINTIALFTKMGIGYIVTKQEDGWSYIKSGN